MSVNDKCKSTKTVNTDIHKKNPWYSPKLHRLKLQLKKAVGPSKKKLRNYYTSSIRKAKSHYLKRTAGTLSATGVWRSIKRVNSSNPMPMNINVNGALCKDPIEICKAFKDHFVQKVDSNRTDSSLKDIFPLLQSAFPSAPAWDLSPCSEDDVALAIDNLKCSMACGPDEIPN